MSRHDLRWVTKHKSPDAILIGMANLAGCTVFMPSGGDAKRLPMPMTLLQPDQQAFNE
ncbi:MAG: hypothetical protein WBV25_00615 [Methylocella sp.]